MTDREELVRLVQRIEDREFDSEREADEAVARFAASVLHPRASGLIFYYDDDFDHEPGAAEIVDRALSYRPFEL